MTEQVGRNGRTVNDVALELGCDWHTINDTVIAYGTVLVDDDPHRIATAWRARRCTGGCAATPTTVWPAWR